MADYETDLELSQRLLRHQACFSQFTDEDISLLAPLLVKKTFSAGATIVTEGDDVDSVFLIISGEAEVKRIRIENNTLKSEFITTLKEGDAIGLNETGFYSLSGKRTATVIAKTKVIAMRLNMAAFHGFALSQSRISNIMQKQAFKHLEPLSKE